MGYPCHTPPFFLPGHLKKKPTLLITSHNTARIPQLPQASAAHSRGPAAAGQGAHGRDPVCVHQPRVAYAAATQRLHRGRVRVPERVVCRDPEPQQGRPCHAAHAAAGKACCDGRGTSHFMSMLQYCPWLTSEARSYSGMASVLCRT